MNIDTAFAVYRSPEVGPIEDLNAAIDYFGECARTADTDAHADEWNAMVLDLLHVRDDRLGYTTVEETPTEHIVATLANVTEPERGALYGVHLSEPHAAVIVRRFDWARLCADESTRFVIPVRDRYTAARLARVINNGRAWVADYNGSLRTGTYDD